MKHRPRPRRRVRKASDDDDYIYFLGHDETKES